MPRTLSSGIAAAIIAKITAPGYLLEIEFSTPVRLCTRGDITVLGNDWIAWSFSVSGFGIDTTSAKQDGTITLANTEYAISTVILEEGIADRVLRLWQFYGDTPADADPVLIFDGVGAESTMDTGSNQVQVKVRPARDVVQFAPARFITAEQGFSMLPPAGTIIEIGNSSYILVPDSF